MTEEDKTESWWSVEHTLHLSQSVINTETLTWPRHHSNMGEMHHESRYSLCLRWGEIGWAFITIVDISVHTVNDTTRPNEEVGENQDCPWWRHMTLERAIILNGCFAQNHKQNRFSQSLVKTSGYTVSFGSIWVLPSLKYNWLSTDACSYCCYTYWAPCNAHHTLCNVTVAQLKKKIIFVTLGPWLLFSTWWTWIWPPEVVGRIFYQL